MRQVARIGLYGIIACGTLALLGSHGYAQDTSNDVNNPTQIVLAEGSNFLVETIGLSEAEALNPGDGDIDFFTLFVPQGLQLDAILVTESDAFTFAFFGFGAGPTLAGSPVLDDAGRVAFNESALGYTLLNIDSPGRGNLLPELSTGEVTVEFPIDPVRFDGNAPLPSGEYAFVLQNRQEDILDFTFDFQTSVVPAAVVPEPTSAGLLLLLGGVGMIRRQRSV